MTSEWADARHSLASSAVRAAAFAARASDAAYAAIEQGDR